MDPQSITESQLATTGVSAGVAPASDHFSQPAGPGVRTAPDDVRGTLAEMAGRDLDAALQLLAERAQYITAASGAAIALRRGEHNDMLCRASAGTNAPELGALLSMEYGLSGESVHTRQTLRCDDAQRDPRVNREGCRQLGIASVVVMPIVSEQQVLGVFELFSGTPRAFEERDISALQRLSGMVATAVQHAVAAQSAVAIEQPAQAEIPAARAVASERVPVPPTVAVDPPVVASVNILPPNDLSAADSLPQAIEGEPERSERKTELEEAKPGPAPKKPLFWSAVMQTPASAGSSDRTAPVVVPPVLRNLQKCLACGFPVSHGRTYCVECEEKQWRGQRLSAPGKETARAEAPASSVALSEAVSVSPLSLKAAADKAQTLVPSTVVANPKGEVPTSISPSVPVNPTPSSNSTLFLSSAAGPESWLAANKYIVGALLIVALVIAAILWLR